MVSDLAYLNYHSNLIIGTYIDNETGQFRGYSHGSFREYVCEKLSDEKYILVDTRLFRKYILTRKLKSEIPKEVLDQFEKIIFSYDLLLFIKGAHSVAWNLGYE